MPISFQKKPQTQNIWTKKDPQKPFEDCSDLTKLPPEVLSGLETQGYDEEDTDKVYRLEGLKTADGVHTYQFKFWNNEWGCSRWPTKKGGSSSGGGGGFGKSAGPREWSYTKMVDFEIGNLNDLHDIMMNSQLAEDETWDLMPFIVMNSKDEPNGIMKKMKRVAMLGSEEKNTETKSETS